ncbi:MAG TPA: hypothetical protein VK974_00600 [Methylophilaceae bacterium]|nr:hypothetical protein [Methylophilaceae bacterium]
MKLQIAFPSFDVTKAPQFDSPALARLLAISQQSRVAGTVEALLCEAMQVPKQADWPLAAIASLGEGMAREAHGYWLLAHPVHFVLQRDYFSMGPRLSLSEGESHTLMDILNQHFADDGLTFLAASTPDYWYLHVEADPEITTTELGLVIGRDTTSYMPQGKGAAKWNRLLNEAQMLLHEHAVNDAREQRGELPVNSLWLSGGGVLPTILQPANKTIYANDIFSKGLALLAGEHAKPLPVSMQAVLDGSHGDVVLVLDEFEITAADAVLKASKQRRVSHLSIDFALHGEVLHLEVKPSDLWKFWKKSQSLSSTLGFAHGEYE